MNLPQVGKALAVAAVAAFAASNAFAADDGDLGATSQGNLNITLTIDDLVLITDLDDIGLGTYTPGANLTGDDTVCVYSNTGGYQITATGNAGGTGPAFAPTGGTSGASIPYFVQWADTGGAGSGTSLTANTALAGQVDSVRSPDCSGGTANNARVFVTVNDADLAAAPADAYLGVLTLLVAPQ
jgi:hypothetical protein